MEKVYCDECKFYSPPYHYTFVTYKGYCSAEKNKNREKNPHLFHTFIPIKTPRELNKNNDCEWFVGTKCIS